eukprot:5891790-Pyramimonas_sp.AAC.1
MLPGACETTRAAHPGAPLTSTVNLWLAGSPSTVQEPGSKFEAISHSASPSQTASSATSPTVRTTRMVGSVLRWNAALGCSVGGVPARTTC